MSSETMPAGPAPMEGQGGYNRRSAVQASGAAPALAMLEQAAREIALPDGDATIVVADYGSSAGQNSMAPMARAIGVRRARIGPDCGGDGYPGAGARVKT